MFISDHKVFLSLVLSAMLIYRLLRQPFSLCAHIALDQPDIMVGCYDAEIVMIVDSGGGGGGTY